MHYAENILDLVGNTPLVRLNRVTRYLPSEGRPLVLAKLEMLNPGGSVKDRIGLPMIEAALNGYRCIFVMADWLPAASAAGSTDSPA